MVFFEVNVWKFVVVSSLNAYCGLLHEKRPILYDVLTLHYSDLDQTFNRNRQLTDYLGLVSFDKTSWVDEINKSFL